MGYSAIRILSPYGCLAHVTDTGRSTYLTTLGLDSDIDHRGTPFSEALLGALRDPGTDTVHINSRQFEIAAVKKTAQFGDMDLQHTADGLAYFDRPCTSNAPTETINRRIEHLCDSALDFRNPINYIVRSLLDTSGFRPRLHLTCNNPRTAYNAHCTHRKTRTSAAWADTTIPSRHLNQDWRSPAAITLSRRMTLSDGNPFSMILHFSPPRNYPL